ncbi:uncharacterized protein B0I36DRAFT_350961 [Microdochium trichocladiopsis]|uniref:Uncharacterized protein n=1 Tax=Microdochium trichocladiopsis TaxID=1682393 RepID=A0A9P8Y3V0_9PEZI|nr:uncharacterized protein B0I36DRAFT_350961 [Microdochium trichocladiopsis]KAH7027432.1 hypothetical protein B0I36DRAFT_350961 [Microdochium trichocladiopsis]
MGRPEKAGDYTAPPLPAALDTDTDGLPVYSATSSVAAAAAAKALVEPLGLVISGQSIYREDAFGLGAAAAAAAEAAGPTQLYAMNRGIVGLSHAASSVTFERVDHAVRQQQEQQPGLPPPPFPHDDDDGDGETAAATAPRITSRNRHIYDLRHIDEYTVTYTTRDINWAFSWNLNRKLAESEEMIPRFFCQAASRRSLGNFGLRQVKYKTAAAAQTTVGYAVVPLARGRDRAVNGELPRFAAGEKGKGFAKALFEVRGSTRRREVVSAAGAAGSSGGGGRDTASRFRGNSLSSKSKGKAAAVDEPYASSPSSSSPPPPPPPQLEYGVVTEWEWIDEFGALVAYEDQILSPSDQGQLLPRLVTTVPMTRELFDVLVSCWCMRVWWQSADKDGRPSGLSTPEGGVTTRLLRGIAGVNFQIWMNKSDTRRADKKHRILSSLILPGIPE